MVVEGVVVEMLGLVEVEMIVKGVSVVIVVGELILVKVAKGMVVVVGDGGDDEGDDSGGCDDEE